jgi:hypothetical protein
VPPLPRVPVLSGYALQAFLFVTLSAVEGIFISKKGFPLHTSDSELSEAKSHAKLHPIKLSFQRKM